MHHVKRSGALLQAPTKKRLAVLPDISDSRQKPGVQGVPWPKMAPRCHELGIREATTRSLDSAIMAPSLNTASSTMSSVGKYLRMCASAKLPRHVTSAALVAAKNAMEGQQV